MAMARIEKLIEEHRERAAQLRLQVASLHSRRLTPIKRRLRLQVSLHERTARELERLHAKAARR